CLVVGASAFPPSTARAQAAAGEAVAFELGSSAPPTSLAVQPEEDPVDEGARRRRSDDERRDRALTLRIRVSSVLAPLMLVPVPLLVVKYFLRSEEGRWSPRARLAIGGRFALAGAGFLTAFAVALVSGAQRHRERR